MTERDSPCILVIDDDSITTLMLSGMLRQAGYIPLVAATGRDGIALVKEERPDLILLDVHLPDIDGFDVCREILFSCGISDIPVLFISANDDSVTRVKGFDAGGVDYIVKPFFGPEVLARVRTHLRLSQATDTIANMQAERIKALAESQQQIFPSSQNLASAGSVAHVLQKHGAGGDFFDVIPIGGDTYDYVVADASGHDLETALWTTGFKALLREYASNLYSPIEILNAVNKSLCKILPEGFFFTVVYVRLNRTSKKLTIANAGHPPALFVALNSDPAKIILYSDVVGVFNDARFQSTEMRVHPGDRILLYTDGLTATQTNTTVSTDTLIVLCKKLQGYPLGDMVYSVTDEMVKQNKELDDVILLGIEV